MLIKAKNSNPNISKIIDVLINNITANIKAINGERVQLMLIANSALWKMQDKNKKLMVNYKKLNKTKEIEIKVHLNSLYSHY